MDDVGTRSRCGGATSHVNYAGRGLTNDSEGTNRNINVSYPTQAERQAANPLTPADPDMLPGTTDTAAPDGPEDQLNSGYIWNAALRAGLTLRNYGFFIDLARYNLPAQYAQYGIPELPDPFATKTQVAYSSNTALRPFTDPYFRGFDNSFPDYFRFTEWKREFTTTYATRESAGLESRPADARSHRKFQHRAKWDKHTRIAGGGQRLFGRSVGASGGEQPIQGKHTDLCH